MCKQGKPKVFYHIARSHFVYRQINPIGFYMKVINVVLTYVLKDQLHHEHCFLTDGVLCELCFAVS